MANKMKIWLAYEGIEETYAYEFTGVPDSALIEASVQAAVTACNERLNTAVGTSTVKYGYLFKYNGANNPAIGVARVTSESTQEVPITLTGGE